MKKLFYLLSGGIFGVFLSVKGVDASHFSFYIWTIVFAVPYVFITSYFLDGK